MSHVRLSMLVKGPAHVRDASVRSAHTSLSRFARSLQGRAVHAAHTRILLRFLGVVDDTGRLLVIAKKCMTSMTLFVDTNFEYTINSYR